ncbi:hypothetical protein FLK61_29005 [Paenalkalicoccus suaedae]|uniref:Post-transcriptional regulator n=1 Tax=Paenalkalicoccus suaedae TaxID=2592382 RepID=A0A859FEW0_9BACI|nr:post-transcriptional regulator [Paenalkalicoccus suaedae]QKS70776.1 hypothetical protein FLK61_29005 [Paenalkalicoccus suaedae]
MLTWNDWRQELEPVLDSKWEEFQLLGYNTVSKDEVWTSFVTKMTRQKVVPESLRLHQITSLLLGLKPNDYMTQMTIGAYKDDFNFFATKETE